MEEAVAAKQTQVGGDWFFWIAGLSLISSVIILSGHSYHPVIGLGTTEMFSDAAAKMSRSGDTMSRPIAFVFDLFASGFYVLYGIYARKGKKWAFLAGIGFYAVDALLLLLNTAFLAVAFHAYALFRIFQGFQAAQRLGVLRVRQSSPYAAVNAPASSDVWPPPPAA